MRIRQVKPDYWRDELMASLPDSVSLFYIGLWQEADDAGWLVWNIPEIGHDLYGYQPRARRERWVRERGQALATVGRLHLHECGHAFLPNLTKHQHLGGKPYRGVQIAHDRDCSRPIADDRPGKVGKGNGNGKVGEGTGGDSQKDERELPNIHDPELRRRLLEKSGRSA